MKYDTHYKEAKKVTFKKYNLNIAGLLFLPSNFNENKKYPAIVITHPGGGVKEQCSSLYGWNLAQNGFVALAFDASHQGESEGLPRCLEDPASRVEDIRSAVDYLTTLDFVDEDKIGAMGVCAGGGYTMNAIQTDLRIKAAAGISTWDVGDSAKNGFPGVNEQNQVLIQKGAAIGTVLVFMMAVVGLSLLEMIILSRVMKKELIIRYVIFMFITFTIVGYFYNFVL